MKKASLFFVAVALSFGLNTSDSEARSFTIGDDRPVAVIVFPDSWKTKVIEDGVEAASPDEGISVTVEAVEIKDIAAATQEGIKYFLESGVTLDLATQTQRQMTIGGLPAVDISWKGKDEDGPTNVGLTFVILNDKDSVLMYFWGDDEGTRLNEPALKAIAESLKPVAR